MFELDSLNEDVFTEEQLEALNTPLAPEEIETKQGNLQYLKGQYAIAKANKIFGVGNWGYEQIGPVEMIETVTSNNNDRKVTLVTAMVKVTVKGCVTFVEQGDCEAQGEGYAALSMARKGAVTDGVKRCLKNFGPAFGLELYLGKQLKNARRPAQTYGGNYNSNRPAAAPAPAPAQSHSQPQPQPQQQHHQQQQPSKPEAMTKIQHEVIKKAQGILKISDAGMDKRLQQLYGCSLEELNKEDAEHLIQVLNATIKNNASSSINGSSSDNSKEKQEAPQPPDGKTSSWCQECGAEADWKSGVGDKGPWGGYKCTAKGCGKMQFVNVKSREKAEAAK